MRTYQLLPAVDYEALGLKAGLEIHHQILTKKKMFCNCPAGIYSKKHNGVVLRHMRPTLSELGEYDGTALMEFKTHKDIIYLLNSDSVCTYEMDDTPPFPVNQEGLDIAVEISLLFGCNIVDEVHIARKQYLDGSIPTGFQRTAVIGVGGELPYKNRKIRIIQITCEEDACREVSDEGHKRTYRTDRLGMPLIEVITYPDMKTPFEVAEVSQLIGRLLRATGKVRRGIGAVRQDVNVSIEGGSRVEIKGVPQFGLIPQLVHNEAIRQKALLNIKKELEKRDITSSFNPQKVELTETLRGSSCRQFSEVIEKGKVIGAVLLHNFKAVDGSPDIILFPTQQGKRFLDEISGRLRVIACLDNMPNLFYSEAFPEYEGRNKDLEKICSVLKAGERDCFIVVWGDKRDVQTALEEVRLRIVDATKGVPNETRRALPCGFTDFERILPGPDRMYPDTDSPPVKITKERTDRIKSLLLEPPWKREKRYKILGIPEHVAFELAISPYAKLFDTLINETGIESKFTASVLIEKIKWLKRKGCNVQGIPESRILELFNEHKRLYLNKRALVVALEKLANNPKLPVKNLLPQALSEKNLLKEIEKILKGVNFVSKKPNNLKQKIEFYTGAVMEQTAYSADPAVTKRLIQELLEKKK
ncbi:MAG: Glu-tRNA(Gln) amidotransferase subunit GatE [Planctomycetota bacterium]